MELCKIGQSHEPGKGRLLVTCHGCKQVIASGVVYRNQYFHRLCFRCAQCHACLVGEKVFNHENQHYCCECYGQLFAEKCFCCEKPINGVGDALCISFDKRHWHPECFICQSCETSLIGRLIIADKRNILCTDCAV